MEGIIQARAKARSNILWRNFIACTPQANDVAAFAENGKPVPQGFYVAHSSPRSRYWLGTTRLAVQRAMLYQNEERVWPCESTCLYSSHLVYGPAIFEYAVFAAASSLLNTHIHAN